jgi:hypothetical protein
MDREESGLPDLKNKDFYFNKEVDLQNLQKPLDRVTKFFRDVCENIKFYYKNWSDDFGNKRSLFNVMDCVSLITKQNYIAFMPFETMYDVPHQNNIVLCFVSRSDKNIPNNKAFGIFKCVYDEGDKMYSINIGNNNYLCSTLENIKITIESQYNIQLDYFTKELVHEIDNHLKKAETRGTQEQYPLVHLAYIIEKLNPSIKQTDEVIKKQSSVTLLPSNFLFAPRLTKVDENADSIETIERSVSPSRTKGTLHSHFPTENSALLEEVELSGEQEEECCFCPMQ